MSLYRMVTCDNFVTTSECIQTFQYRAMSMACFLYALCLKSGKGVQKDELLADQLFSKVCIFISSIVLHSYS